MFCLSKANPGLFACETIPSLQEAEILLQALLQFPGIPAWFSFTCRHGLHTVHGELIGDCANSLSCHPQVAAIGVNCTSPDHISSLILKSADKPISPSSFIPILGKPGTQPLAIGLENLLRTRGNNVLSSGYSKEPIGSEDVAAQLPKPFAIFAPR